MDEEMTPAVSDTPITQPEPQPTSQPTATPSEPSERKKSLAKTFLDKVKEKSMLTRNEAAQTVDLASEAASEVGRQAGIQEGMSKVLNPQNVAIKRNNYKQGVVQALSAGPTGGAQ